MKIAKLVYTSFVTRVIVDTEAKNDEYGQMRGQVLRDISSKLSDESWREHLCLVMKDEECPYGTLYRETTETKNIKI